MKPHFNIQDQCTSKSYLLIGLSNAMQRSGSVKCPGKNVTEVYGSMLLALRLGGWISIFQKKALPNTLMDPCPILANSTQSIPSMAFPYLSLSVLIPFSISLAHCHKLSTLGTQPKYSLVFAMQSSVDPPECCYISDGFGPAADTSHSPHTPHLNRFHLCNLLLLIVRVS